MNCGTWRNCRVAILSWTDTSRLMARASSVRPLTSVVAGALLLSALGCSTHEATAATATVSGAVAFAAVNRAVTGDCWGRCSNGYVCNHESGLCEPGECNPSCTAGYQCSVVPAGYACTPEGGTTWSPSASNAPVLGSGETREAERNARAQDSTRAASELTPARNEAGQVQIEPGNPGPVGGPSPGASGNE